MSKDRIAQKKLETFLTLRVVERQLLSHTYLLFRKFALHSYSSTHDRAFREVAPVSQIRDPPRDPRLSESERQIFRQLEHPDACSRRQTQWKVIEETNMLRFEHKVSLPNKARKKPTQDKKFSAFSIRRSPWLPESNAHRACMGRIPPLRNGLACAVGGMA